IAERGLVLRRSTVTRGTDSPQSLLARLGVTDAGAAAFLRDDAVARGLITGRGGKLVQAVTDEHGALSELVARYPAAQADQAKTAFTRLTISRQAGRWTSRVETAPLVAQTRLGSGTVRTSLFAATDDAQLPDSVASQLAEIFSNEIDFRRGLRKGDTFSVVYEALTADGEVVPWSDGAGRVLAADFVNDGKLHQAIWFDAAGAGQGGYFGPDGESKRRDFLASPVAFSRITSGFSMRYHPILHKWLMHEGVDYGAPTGTPVRTVGDGVVSFAGRENGYGNVIKIDHSKGRSTLYAHLSKIDVKKGQHVTEGEHIGDVGQTGWATGPHLHFEYHLNGVYTDPAVLAKSTQASTIAAPQRARFAEVASGLRHELALADTLDQAGGQAE
ncbi:MAG: M23 family metallopeptidase, partial [Burkholderiales bacterium]|nr:M23 family metallopeptidase [Burkholderiales bacterium]